MTTPKAPTPLLSSRQVVVVTGVYIDDLNAGFVAR